MTRALFLWCQLILLSAEKNDPDAWRGEDYFHSHQATTVYSFLLLGPWLVKTKETFKLADLQLLGGALQAQLLFAD